MTGPPTWTFAGGGSLSITGNASDGETVIASGELYSGPIISAMANDSEFTSLGVSGMANPDVLDYFGLSRQSRFDFTTSLEFLGADSFVSLPTGGFKGGVARARLRATPVPEPASLFWFTGGLIALALLRRRIFTKR